MKAAKSLVDVMMLVDSHGVWHNLEVRKEIFVQMEAFIVKAFRKFRWAVIGVLLLVGSLILGVQMVLKNQSQLPLSIWLTVAVLGLAEMEYQQWRRLKEIRQCIHGIVPKFELVGLSQGQKLAMYLLPLRMQDRAGCLEETYQKMRVDVGLKAARVYFLKNWAELMGEAYHKALLVIAFLVGFGAVKDAARHLLFK